jgi:RNA polymerase sigma factor (sigma-70 family)
MRPSEPSASAVEILRRAVAGEQAAWAELDLRYRDFVRGVLAGRLAGELRARADVEDLVQAVFLELARHAPLLELRDEAALRAWLARVASSKLTDLARRAASEPLRTPLEDGPGSEVTQEDLAAAGELRQLLLDRLAALAPAERALIEARYGRGETWPEIARQSGLAQSTARRHTEELVQRLLRGLLG